MCIIFLFSWQGGETENLLNRLEEAEKALALKQAHIDKLKEQLEHKGELQETITVLTAQVRKKFMLNTTGANKPIFFLYITNKS